MTIQSFKLMRKGPIRDELDGSVSGEVQFLVTSDDVNEDQDAILGHGSCPVKHTTAHPDNAYLICREREVAEYQGNDLKWIVTCTYNSRAASGNDEYNQANSVVEGGLRGVLEDTPAWVDYAGNPVVNSADDLYEGLTKKRRLIQCPVRAVFTSPPWDLFTELNGTINSNIVTIHGQEWEPGYCQLDVGEMERTPKITTGGTKLWPVDYTVNIDPYGHNIILPDRGPYHYIYQTRANSTTNNWIDTGYDAYAAEGDSQLKRRIKVKTSDDGEADGSDDFFLNDHGEQIKGSFTSYSGTCDTAGRDDEILNVSPALTAANVGMYVTIRGAGPFGRDYRGRIETQSGSSATLSIDCQSGTTGAVIVGGGIYARTYTLDDVADWTSLPLPNNQ